MTEKAPNPFNPSVPATLRTFVGREPELKIFRQKLSFAENGSPAGLAISGDWGIGKTSLLVKYEMIAKEENCFVVRVGTLSPDIDTIKKFSRLIMTNFLLKCNQMRSLSLIDENFEAKVNQLILDANKKESPLLTDRFVEAAPAIILRDFIEAFCKIAKGKFNATVLMIDELDRLNNAEGHLMFLREIFQRLSESNTNCLLVISGRKILLGKTGGEFAPLYRFFDQILHIRNFDLKETDQFLKLRLNETKVKLDDDVIKKLFDETEGHPYVLTVAMMILYQELPEDKKLINFEYYQSLEETIFFQISETFFKPTFKSTTPGAREVLVKLAENDKEILEFSEVVSQFGKYGSEISPYLAELVRKSCLFRIDRGKYKFFHKLFRRFVLKQDKSLINPRKISRKRREDTGATKLS